MPDEAVSSARGGVPEQVRPPGIRLVGHSLRASAGPLARLAAWSAAEALPAMLSGILIARALDYGFLAGHFGTGCAILLGLLAAHAVGAVATRFTYPLAGAVVERLRDDLLTGVVDGIVRGQQERHAGPDGGLVARATQQVETVRRSSTALLTGLRRFVFTMTATAVGLAALAEQILLIALPPILLATVLFALLLATLVRRQRAAILANENVARTVGDAVAGSRDILAYRQQGSVVDAAGRVLRGERSAQQALARATAVRTAVTAIGTYAPVLGVLAAAPWLLEQGVSVGVLVGAATYLGTNVEPAMRQLTEVVGGSGLQFAITLQRLSATCRPPESAHAAAPAGPLGGPAPAGPGDTVPRVEVRGADFAYGSDSEPVIRALNLSIDPGRHLAVAGPSGIGKSTLAGLIAGIDAPDRGEVLVGGVPIFGRADRTDLVALVPQESYVVATVRENLDYLRPGAATAEVEAAVRAVGADGLVRRLGGLGGTVDPAVLSHGERQLLALARAYLSPAPVLILDEATCHLDPAAEAVAEAALQRRPGTLITVAHRISSAMRADQVLLLDGTTAVVGSHSALLDASPLYRDMVGRWQG